MKERLLFHLRLSSVVNSNSRHVKKDAEQPGRRSPSATLSSPVAAPVTSAREEDELTCTCIDSSSPSCIIVGFKGGGLHFYERSLKGHDDDTLLCEEARWKHSVSYPTRTLRDGNASFAPPDITCVQRGPNGILAIGTSNGIVLVMQWPSRDGFTARGRLSGSGFHHRSHKGNRVNCLLWDPSGDRLFSVCEGGTVIVARNLCRTQDTAPESPRVVHASAISFWGMMPPPGGGARRNNIRGVAKGLPPQAIIVGQLRSPGVQLDLGRVKTSLAETKPTCDVLLVMTRSKAVLLYFQLDQDLSTVAPYEATVDLNVLPPDFGAMAADARASPDASDTRPAPPSVTDLGGCLWGPGVAAAVGANRSTGGVHHPGAVDQSLRQAWSDSSPRTPRPVLFAYIAQPGGKLWRVGLSDGEVESTHHPRSAAGEIGSSVRDRTQERTASEGSLEIGLMRVVYAGKSQAILCWRHRPGEEEVTLSLLDCRTHGFGGVCRALSGVIGSSGSLLEEDVHANMEPGPERRHRGVASDRPTPIRVLRGGTMANVTQLLGSEDDITESSPFPMRGDSASYEARAEAAAIKVQRLWRHRRRRRLSQWKSSIIQTYQAQRSQTDRGAGSPSSSPANAEVGTTRMVDTRPFAKNPNGDATLDAAVGERHRDGFSIHDSLGALDAAERVLRLTSRSQDTGPDPSDVMTPPSAVTADSDNKGDLPEGKSSDGTGPIRRSRSAASSDGTPEDSAKALVRRADALLRETAPVLRRSRSFVALSPSQGSLSSGPSRMDASEGWHGPTKGMEGMARRAANDEQRVGDHLAEVFSALPDKALAAQICVNDTVIPGAVEDVERKRTEAVTGQGSSASAASAPVPPSPMPTEATRADEGVEDAARGDAVGSKSAASSVSSPERPEATRVPYPGGQDDVAIEPWSTARTRSSRPLRSGTTGYLHSSAPQKHLLTPVQDVVGSLFQRSVQAVNDAFQPGGGAVSDDSSPYDDEDEGMYRHEGDSAYQDGNADAFEEQQQEESLASNGNPFGNDDSGVDGLTSGSITNNSYRSNWGSSTERSKDDSHQAALPAPHPGPPLGEDGPPASSMSRARIQAVQPGGLGEGNDVVGVLSRHTSGIVKRRGEGEGQQTRGMLFVSGMTGVKRQRLGVLRSRRNTRIKTGTAAVRDLPRSAREDSSPFVPPSQYEVRLNVRRGLGLSLQITGNDVRVKSFSPVGDGEMGPAQACGQIQVGDALLGVNQQELSQLSHQSVVELLRGLLRESKDQLLLLRFAFSQDSQRAAAPQPPFRDAAPYPQHITHPSPLAGISTDATRASLGTVGKGDNFRPDSWHGSRPVGSGTREQARSASPPHLADRGHVSVGRQEDDRLSFGISRTVSRRYSSSDLTEDVNEARLGVEIGLGARVISGVDGESGESGDSAEGRMGNRDYVSGTLLSEGQGVGGREREPGELWGQFSGGGISNRHVYLGDMGHARTQRTLGYIARDLQVLYGVRDASEISRFFHGGSRLSLVDPSPSASDNRSRPPSVLLSLSNSETQHYFAKALLPASSSSPGGGEAFPPRPRGPPRGRRRKRTPYARNRESSGSAVEAVGLRSDVDEDDGERIEEDPEQGGVIHLSRCEEVVADELHRLETGLEEQTGRLASWDQKSGLKRLVAKILQQTRREGADDHVNPDGRPRGTRRERSRRENRSGDAYGMPLSKGGGKGDSSRDPVDFTGVTSGALGDGLTDSDHEGIPRVENARRQGDGDGRRGDDVANIGGELSSNHDAGGAVPVSADDGGRYSSGGHTGPDPACDIFSEGVSTAAMRQELLSNSAVEMLGAPPRSLPTVAYDLQTALESVQHLATETLNEVVHSKATRGLSDDIRGLSLSPTRAGRSGFGGMKEAKEAAAAAGLGSGWESAWPPRELTAALGLVTARQMAHAMRCDSEPLFQIWMRYFTPLDVKYRDMLWGALNPSPTDSIQVISGIFHRQLVCGLITLYAQVHISWPFLACPADDPSAVGLRSLRLGSTWFSIERDSPDSYGHARNTSRARFGTMDASNAGVPVGGHGFSGGEPNSPAWGMDSDLGAGSAGGGDVRNGGLDESGTRPHAVDQWDEEMTNKFIEEYGCYLDADAIAAATSCREMAEALHNILRLAEKCESYKVKERILHQLLRGPRTPVLRSPMIGPMPMPRSPSVTSDTRTPTVISPASASMRAASRPTSISPTGMSAAVERTVPAAVDDLSRPMEEDAVRKALGLPPSRRGMPVEHGRDTSLAQAGQLHELGEVGATAWDEGGNAMSGSREGDAGVGAYELAGSAPLCLLLSNLVELFRWDVASAAEICADIYPGIRPWNVYLALYQDAPWSAPNGTNTPNTGGPGRGYHTSDESGIRNDAAFHAYLWAMMERHPQQCRQDWKMVQRCIQLSLRIAAKLQQLPLHHPLHGFCRAATRNVRCSPQLHRRRRQRVPGHRETFSTDLANELMNLTRGPAGRRVGSGEGVPAESGYLFDAEAGMGEGVDDSACHRYSHIVEVVAKKWCEDPDAFAVDPLWLLQKLRAFRKWSLAFQICSGVTRSWEESSWMDGGRAFDAHDDRLGTHGMNLASSLAVLDTLMDACLASFWEGNVACLGSALGALWAAEGALQNVGVLYTRDSFSGSGDGETPHLTGRPGIPSSESNERRDEPGVPREGSIHGVGATVQAVNELEAEAGGVASQPVDDDNVAYAEEDGVSRGTGGGPCRRAESSAELKTSWVEDSRTMDVIRSLTERCRDNLTPDEAIRDGGAGHDVPVEGRGGLGPSAPGGDGLEPTLSLLDLGKAVVDGLGPEAAADVLADCPRLMDRMSPEFFRLLAERRAALCQQEALEAVLLHQATASAWALGGMATATATATATASGTSSLGSSSGRTSGARGGVDRLQPLGARLAWLACEEITCFFHQNENPLPQAGGRRGGGPREESSLPRGRRGLHGAARRLFSQEESEDDDDDLGNGGHMEKEREEGNRYYEGERERKSQEQAVRSAVAQSGLDVLFAGHAHHGTTLLAGSPCAFCGLSLHDSGRLPSSLSGPGPGPGARAADLNCRKPGPDDDGRLEIVVARCGRGYHVRCLEECMPISHSHGYWGSWNRQGYY